MNLKVITKYKMALIQNQLFKDKQSILLNVSAKIKDAVAEGCKVCLLGEFFNSIFQDKHLELHAEDFSNEKERPTFDLLRDLSKQFGILIIGGLAERGETKLFNAAVAFNNGQQVASYRKNHLFNVDIPGGIKHTESD